jgi:hypothetical protein
MIARILSLLMLLLALVPALPAQQIRNLGVDIREKRPPRYETGEPLRLDVRVQRDAYVYMFGVNSLGDIVAIYPGPSTRNPSRLDGGRWHELPGTSPAVRFERPGTRQIHVIATTVEDKELEALARSARPLSHIGSVDAIYRYHREYVEGLLGSSSSRVRQAFIGRDVITISVTQGKNSGGPSTTTPGRGGRVSITSTPSGAEVYIGDEMIGRTPLANASVPLGEVQFRIVLDGYRERTVTTRLRPGNTETFNVRLQPDVPASGGTTGGGRGTLTVTSTPEGAAVIVNGQLRGYAPVTLSLSAGEHDVRVRKPGLKEYASKVTVKAGETTAVQAALGM